MFPVGDGGYYNFQWTCVPCASFISVSGGDVLTDDSTETCLDTMSSKGSFKNFSLLSMKTCMDDNIFNIEVTGTSTTECVNVQKSIFVRKFSDCDNVFIPCKMTTTKLLNDRKVCALKCICTEAADFCELLIHSGVSGQNLELCEIKMIL